MYRVQAFQVDLGFVDVEGGSFIDLRRAMAHMRSLVSDSATKEVGPQRCRIVDETGRVHSAADAPDSAPRQAEAS
jgi:hypothetical protein